MILYPPEYIIIVVLGAIVRQGAAFGQGSGPIFVDNVRCSGMENRLFDCENSGIEVTSCGHNKDAGVVCIAGNT